MCRARLLPQRITAELDDRLHSAYTNRAP